MFYTTYFAKLNSLPDIIVPISICGKAPDWYKGIQYKKLAPKLEFWKVWEETKDNDYYIENYYKSVLNKLNVEDVLKELYEIAGSKNIALVCYEKPGDFCHRHLVADWFREYNIPITEFTYGG